MSIFNKWIGIAMLILGLSISACHRVPEEHAASDKYRLVWNDNPSTTMTIVWDQLEPSEVAVYYGTEDHGRKYWKYANNQFPYRSFEYYEMHTNYAKLKNLQPDQRYYFVIKDARGVSERYWFKTAPDSPKAFTFVAGGDTKSSDEPLEAGRSSNRVVAKLRPLFVLYNGDFTSGNGTDPFNWKQWLTDWHLQTTTVDGRMIPIVPVHGNHENGNHGNLHFMFDAPYQNNDSSQIYYSLSFGGNLLHTIALNSEIEEGGAQKAWLENDLKRHRDFQFKLAGFHKPFYPHTQRKRENTYQYKHWAFLFDQYGLDLGFDADSHMHKITFPIKPDTLSEDSHMGFIRDDRTGTMYIGEGSWGAHPRVNDDDKPWTLASGSFNQIKWLHIFPKEEEEAHINIYTVITADYGENEEFSTYNDNATALSEENIFDVPQDLNLFINPDGSNHVRFPYVDKSPQE